MQIGSVSGSPLYQAGVEFEDVLLKLDGKKLTSAKALTAILKKHKPGDKVTLEFMQRGQKKTAEITLVENPDLILIPFEKDNKPLPEAAKKFRENWLK